MPRKYAVEHTSTCPDLPMRLRDALVLQSISKGPEFLFSQRDSTALFRKAFEALEKAIKRPEIPRFMADGLKYTSIWDYGEAVGGRSEQVLYDAEEALATFHFNDIYIQSRCRLQRIA